MRYSMEQKTDFRSMIENLKRKYAESPVPEDGTAAIIAPVSITLEELRLSRFPARYKDATFEGYRFYGTAEQQDRQRKLIDHLRRGKSVVMYGNNGTGKTMLAFCAIREQILLGNEAVYASMADIVDEVKQGFSDNIASSRIVDKYIGYDYLVIDEMDKAYGTPTEFLSIFKIINGRYVTRRPTVLISNASDSEVIDIIGKSSFERVVEDGAKVNMNWESYRLRRA